MQMGELMPQTATNYPNLIVVGSVLIVVGLGVLAWFWWRERDHEDQDQDNNHQIPIK
jgi:hypothetical protein